MRLLAVIPLVFLMIILNFAFAATLTAGPALAIGVTLGTAIRGLIIGLEVITCVFLADAFK